jgi:hypothetical protein
MATHTQHYLHWFLTSVSHRLSAAFATEFMPDQYEGKAGSAMMDA